MAFLIDLSQIEQSGIQYVNKYLNLDNLYISKVTGIRDTENSIVSGNLYINKGSNNQLDFELYGNIETKTGIVFNKNGLIGIRTNPTGYGIHIGNNNYYNGGIYINSDNLNNSSEILLLTSNEEITGSISKDISGNIIIKNLNEGSNNPSVSFKSKNSILSINTDNIYLNGLSFNTGIYFSGFLISGTGYELQIKNSNKKEINSHYYLLNLFDINGTGGGIISLGLLRGLGYTGNDLLITGLINYDNSKYQFPNLQVSGSNCLLSISGYETGFFTAGSVIELNNDVKKQYFITGNNFSTLELQKQITGFYTGEYTIYLKRVERYHNTINNSPFTGYKNSIIRIENLNTNLTKNVKWHLYQEFNTNNQSIVLWTQNSGGQNLSSVTLPTITNEPFGNNFIYLLKLTNTGLNSNIKIASYDHGTKNYTEYTGTGWLNSPQIFYSNPASTELLLESGCIYEFGLINKQTSEIEDSGIFSKTNILDAISENIINQNNLKFLFKLNYGSGNILYDYTGGYTGKIINVDESYWI